MLYLSICEGDDPEQTVPILGSADPMVIRGVLEILARRLGASEGLPARRGAISRIPRSTAPSGHGPSEA